MLCFLNFSVCGIERKARYQRSGRTSWQFFDLGSYPIEVAKTTAAPLVVKFGVKASGDCNANSTVLLVFKRLLVPAC